MDGTAIASVPPALESAQGCADAGDRVAALFDAHHARLFRLARRMVRPPEDPADIVQETFLRAARAPGKVPVGASNQEAWLVRVLINICRDAWRQRAVRTKAAAEGLVGGPDATDPAPGVMAHAIVWQALGRLAPRRRAILIMYELEGRSITDVAAVTGVAPVTVRWHLMMARREMARALGDRP